MEFREPSDEQWRSIEPLLPARAPPAAPGPTPRGSWTASA